MRGLRVVHQLLPRRQPGDDVNDDGRLALAGPAVDHGDLTARQPAFEQPFDRNRLDLAERANVQP